MTLNNIIEICVAIDIAILGIAYPIIIDKISNIGDKYSSEYIPVLFNNEIPQKTQFIKINKKKYGISIFKLTLFANLFSLIFLIFNFKSPFNWDNWLINNSAQLTVFTLTFTLIVLFFIWLGKVALYNGKSNSLLTYLISKYNKTKLNTEIRSYHLKAINELALYAIEKQDEHLQETLLQFYYTLFTQIRKNHKNAEPLIYPVDLYFLVNRLSEIAVDSETKLRAIEYKAVCGVWLLGEDFEEITISSETYKWLWRNIYSICCNPRLVKMFWGHSCQYFDFRLEWVMPNYDMQQSNIQYVIESEKRNIERNKFLEFHFAIGGLMLYKKQYKTISYFFKYSQSRPPRYVLLPNSMTEIFIWFENFRNDYKYQTQLDFEFYFPGLDNLGNKSEVKYFICLYITILFIRQFTLKEQYTFQNHTAQPSLPQDVNELYNWLDNIQYFEKCLNVILSDKKLIKQLELKDLTENSKPNFFSFIYELRKNIETKIGDQKQNAELSDSKIKKFYSNSNIIIQKSFNYYKKIFSAKSEEHIAGSLKLSVNGEVTLMSKSAFTENDTPHLNYDTTFAKAIAINKIQRYIPNSFVIAKTKRYLLNSKNIINGLEIIISESSEIVIVGVNISYHLNEIIEKSIYKDNIINIPSTDNDLKDVIFILKRTDLPTLDFKKIEDDEIEELQLNLIGDEIYLYASVIDINTQENAKIKEQWKLIDKSTTNSDLKVQIALSFLSIIHWKNNREVIQINIASEFREQGIQNDINDILPLSK